MTLLIGSFEFTSLGYLVELHKGSNYMKSIFTAVAVTIMLVLLFTSCGRISYDETFPILESRTQTIVGVSCELSTVLDSAFSHRYGIVRPGNEQLLPLVGERNFSFVEYSRLTSHTPARQVSSDVAQLDVEIFFSALANMYGPYFYFGGDEVFLPVRDNIIEGLSQQDFWYPQELVELLHFYLSIHINDGHFVIGNMSLYGGPVFFSYTGRFYRGENGFINNANDAIVAEIILSCHPDWYFNVEDSFRLSMCEAGDTFFYSLVIPIGGQGIPGIPRPETVRITHDNGLVTYAPILHENFLRMHLVPHVSLTYAQGFPVVTINSMATSIALDGTLDADHAKRFLAYAEVVKDEPVIILDLRGNIGGRGELPVEWFYRVIGREIPLNVATIIAYDEDRFNRRFSDSQGLLPHIYPAVKLDDNHMVNKPLDAMVQNDQLIIILTDRLTASAAELATDIGLSLENVLIIGQNTAGVYLTSASSTVYTLPGSGMEFHFHFTVRAFPPGLFSEGVGFAPDIWVTGCALTATINMLNNHIIRE